MQEVAGPPGGNIIPETERQGAAEATMEQLVTIRAAPNMAAETVFTPMVMRSRVQLCPIIRCDHGTDVAKPLNHRQIGHGRIVATKLVTPGFLPKTC